MREFISQRVRTHLPTNVLTSRVREVAENIAEVQTGHSDLRDNHLQESTESRENTELVLVKTETSSSTEVAALHDYQSRALIDRICVCIEV